MSAGTLPDLGDQLSRHQSGLLAGLSPLSHLPGAKGEPGAGGTQGLCVCVLLQSAEPWLSLSTLQGTSLPRLLWPVDPSCSLVP